MKIVLKLVLALTLLVLITASLVVTSTIKATSAGIRLHEVARPPIIVLDSTFNPAALTMKPGHAPPGGAPFCFSGSLGTIICYPPNFLKTAYDFPSTLTGQGATIVIVDAFGSPSIRADLSDFDGNFSIPAPPSFTILCGPTWTGALTDQCPTPKTTDPNFADELSWAEEITLDVTQAHALAPGANIILVVSNSDMDVDLNAAETAVVTQPKLAGSIMTQSFGEPDDLVGCYYFPCNSTGFDGNPTPHFDPTIRTIYNSNMAIAISMGWTVMASSGDDGANEAFSAVGTGELTPSYPATNPDVLAVGGTNGFPYGGHYGTSNPHVLHFPPGPGGTLKCAAGATCPTGLVVINGGVSGCSTTATRTSGVPTSCFPTGYGGEQAWQEVPAVEAYRGSTGGGISNDYYAGYPAYGYPTQATYTRPSYQSKLPTIWTLANGTKVESGSGMVVYNGGRATPDVAFNAASEGGVLAYMGPSSLLSVIYPAGRWVVFGGTSAASPAWAAIIALLQQAHGGPVGFINPAIYTLAQSSLYSDAFHDIRVGNNTDAPVGPIPFCSQFCEPGKVSQTGYVAKKGYDLTTGWGSPDVAHFITDILPLLPPYPVTPAS